MQCSLKMCDFVFLIDIPDRKSICLCVAHKLSTMDVVTIILYDHKLGWAGKSDAKVSVVFWQMANHTQGKKKTLPHISQE